MREARGPGMLTWNRKNLFNKKLLNIFPFFATNLPLAMPGMSSCVLFGTFCSVFVFNGELAPGRLPGRGQGLHLCALSTGRPLPVRARLGRVQTIIIFVFVSCLVFVFFACSGKERLWPSRLCLLGAIKIQGGNGEPATQGKT